jgi:glutamate carboxypeptidase
MTRESLIPMLPLPDVVKSNLASRQQAMEQDLSTWVGMNTHTPNKSGVDALGVLLSERLEAMGFRVAELVGGVTGRTLVARLGYELRDSAEEAEVPANEQRPLLLIGHMDSVFALTEPPATMRVDAATHRAFGPAVADMKGGLVIMIHALEALHETGLLAGRSLRVVLNSDEETGSALSGEIIRAEAAECSAALVFEAGRPAESGASTVVTQRKGLLRVRVRARGRSAHAGVDPSAGASAVRELAVKVKPIEELAQNHAGLTVLVGRFQGGTAANTVPAEAHMDVDVRFDDDDQRQDVEDAIQGLLMRPEVRDPDGRPRVACSIVERVHRPAMEPTEAAAALVEHVLAAATDLGQNIVPEARGGSSDAALAMDAGCPAVCGLGAVGGAFHTPEEWTDLHSLQDRARLLALLILRLGGKAT